MTSHPRRPSLWAAFLAAVLVGLALPAVATAVTAQPTNDPAWSWQVPAPQGNPLEAVTFLDSHNGWAVGRYGTILHATDGGATWTAQLTGTRADLTSVCFVDDADGWAVGTCGTIFHSADGGLTWQAQLAPTIQDFSDVWFINDLEGWAVGAFAGTYHTTDGGLTWSAVRFPTIGRLRPVAVWCDASGVGVMGCGSRGPLIHTIDGGKTWALSRIAHQQWYDQVQALSFVSPREGWAIGDALFHTTDGGATWTRNDAVSGSGVCFVDDLHGWLCSGPGVYATTDGGATWRLQRTFSGASPVALCFASASTGWAVGESGAIRATTDGGSTWSLQSSTATGVNSVPGLAAVAFADGQTGCAVGAQGTVLQTSDGGAGWTARVSGTGANLSAVAFATSQLGYAGGKGGVLLETADGGRSWDRLVSAMRADIVAIAAPDAAHVVLLGHEQGAHPTTDLARSSDGGVSWTLTVVGHSYELPAMSWPSAQDGWLALGNDLWHSSDGGATWRRRFRLPADDLGITSVCFPDSSDGWIVCEGDDGFLMHTADGGATWQRAHLSYEAEFAAYFGPVLFSDALHGWVLAWGYDPNEGPRVMSSLLHTVDGGATWSGVGLGTSGGIRSLAAAGDAQLWAVGSAGSADTRSLDFDGQGIVLHSTCGGGSPPVTECSLPDRWGYCVSSKPVTLTLSVNDTGSGVAGTWYRLDRARNVRLSNDAPSAWAAAGSGTQVTISAPADHSGDGFYVLHYFSRDPAGDSELEHVREVMIDTLGPTCAAMRPPNVRRGRVVTLRCTANDATSTWVRVTMQLWSRRGRLVAEHRVSLFAIGDLHNRGSWRYRCNLPPGRYRYEVRGRDEAGNPQVKVGWSVLVVRP